MSFIWIPQVTLLLVSVCLGGWLTWYTFQRRQQPGVPFIVWLVLSWTWWMLCRVLEALGADQGTTLFWATAGYVSAGFICPLWLLFALQYTGRRTTIQRRSVALLLASGFYSFLAASTNNWHHLWWSDIQYASFGRALLLDVTYGPAFWLHIIINYFYLSAGNALYLLVVLRTSPSYRRQASLMIVASSIPLLGNVASAFDLIEGLTDLNITAFCFVLGASLLIYVFFHYQLLDLMPVARRTIVRWLPDAIIVTDTAGRIVDLNPAARALGAVREEEAIGRPPAEVFTQLAESLEQACHGAMEQTFEKQIRLRNTDPADSLVSQTADERTFQFIARPFSDHKGKKLGCLITLRDITTQIETDSALARRNTVLAMLRKIDHDILTATDLNERLQVVVEGLVTIFDAALARVWLFEQDELVLRANAGLNTHIDDESKHTAQDRPFLSHIVNQGPYLTNAVDSDPHIQHLQWAQREELIAFAGYPLMVEDQVIGVLTLFARHAISEEDFTLLGDFANQAAISVHSDQLFEAVHARAQRLEEIATENARLYQQTQRKANELAALVEIGREISAAHDLPRVLELIASRAREVLDVDDSDLYMLEPTTQTLRAVVALGKYTAETKATPVKMGQGIVGRVAASGVAEMVNRVDLDPRSVQIPGTPVEPQSLLCAPLISQGRAIGVLALSRMSKREFVQTDLDFLDSLAQQASIAIENVRLVEAERAARIRADVLRQVSRAASSTLDINEILKRTLTRLRRMLTYDTASVLLFRHGDSPPLVVTSHEQDDAQARQIRLRLNDGLLLNQLRQDHRPIVIADVQADERWVSTMELEHVRGWLGAPLLVRNQVIGALMLESTQRGFYAWEDATLIASVARQAAIAIENARLFESARQRVAELSILFDASQTITSTLDRNALLNLVAEKIGQAADATSAYVCSMDEAAGTTTVVAEYMGPDASSQERVSDLGATYPLWDLAHTLKAIKANQPLTYNLSEMSPNNPERAHLEEYGGNAVLIVPLCLHGEVFGYVELWDNREGRVFSPAEIRLCQTIAHQAVLAHKNAQLYRDAQERAETLAVLLEIDADISSELAIERLLDKVIRRAAELLKRKASAVWLYDEQADLLRCEISLNAWRDMTGMTLHPGEGINGRVFQTGQPLAVDDYPTWAGAAESFANDPIGPTVGIPLVWKGQVRGVLSLSGQQGDPSFSEAEITTLSLFAAQATIALENARLFDELQQRADELAAANTRLQELDQIKDQFIQNVSHELRTPLALIRGHAEALDSGLLGKLSEELQQSVTVIARRSRIMSELVEDITTLLEVEAQATPMALVSVTEIVQSIVDDFRALAKRERLTLRTEIAPDLPLIVGQARHLYKMFDNLINNAVKFTPAEGNITVRLFSEEDQLVFQISDTGIGIPSDKQTRVFDRFYQADGSTRRRYGGTGLGLALVKEIVQAHGGQVTLESEPGRGSTFTVILPVGH
ncbi:MAG: GAF domain-containing protein [Anaerolineae bacterium]